jgi:Flp pilus assembly pilin Flp
MSHLLRKLVREEDGQDLIEYTLLLAFIVLATAALMTGAGTSVKGVWSVANSKLALANISAS